MGWKSAGTGQGGEFMVTGQRDLQFLFGGVQCTKA
jgi:hypothetical protein